MTEDHRIEPPHGADERATLTAFLDYQRQTLLRKVAGLSDADARRRLLPSDTTLLGIVRHLADVESWWFQAVFAGETLERLDHPLFSSLADPDGDWHVGPDDTLGQAIAVYEAACVGSRRVVAAASLDDVRGAGRVGRRVRRRLTTACAGSSCT
jgi:hypothetical protein